MENKRIILIIEDEPMERDCLKNFIASEFLNMKVMSAENSQQALDILHKEKIELVITDIDLPGESGLKIIEDITQQQGSSSPAFLITTSYSYFQYAQQALKFGVEEFLVKPINLEKLKGIVLSILNRNEHKHLVDLKITSIMSKMKVMRQAIEKDFLQALIKKEEEGEIKYHVSMLNYEVKQLFVIVIDKTELVECNMQRMQSSLELNDLHCIFDYTSQKLVICVLSENKITPVELEKTKELILSCCGEDTMLCVGGIKDSYLTFCDSYKEALQAYELESKESSSFNVNKWSVYVSEFSDELLVRYLKYNVKEVNRQLDQFFQYIASSHKVEIFKMLMVNLYEKIKKQYPSIDIVFPDFVNLLNEDTLRMRNQLMSFLKPVKEFCYQNSNQLVVLALEYIGENYKKNLSLNDLAKKLDVTPQYVSRILSSYTNLTFTELITKNRIDESKIMLKNNIRINEIAYSLGFQSQNYFTKVFKKMTGMTPREYKNMITLKKNDEQHVS